MLTLFSAESLHIPADIYQTGVVSYLIYTKHGDDVVKSTVRNGDDAVRAMDNGVTPSQMSALEEKGITPDKYADEGIVEGESAAAAEVIGGKARTGRTRMVR